MQEWATTEETWLSGRKRHRAKVLGGQPPRGFESHRLRNEPDYEPSIFMVSLEIFKKIVSLLEENNLNYHIFGGFAFDGLRGHITREHKDIDIYLDSNELDKLKRLFDQNGHILSQKGKMYFIKSPDLRVGVCLTTKDGESILVHGNNTVVSTPSAIWNNNTMYIDGAVFNCAPNELLVFDSQYSTHEEDKRLAASLKCNTDMLERIRVV